MKIDRDNPKCERALALHEKGVGNEAIGIRLGIPQSQVSAYLARGRERREKEAAE